MGFYSDTHFVLIQRFPESSGGLEEGYNRAWLEREEGVYETLEEALDALAERNAAVRWDEWTYFDIVKPQWYLDGVAEMQRRKVILSDVPF